ncbi:MAG: CvpA family protein [Azoarcus sp.]|jgi:membrane protein required for colicin V production|nr:CvpA family protein [Azoarcus sp.]
MTTFDYVFLAILGLSAFIGLWRGLMSEILAVAAWGLAIAAAWRFSGDAERLLDGVIANPNWRIAAAFALVIIAVLLLMAIVRWLLRQLIRAAGLGASDRFFGALFGIARGLAIAFVAVLLGGLLPSVQREPWWEQALFSRPLETAVIAAKPWLPDIVADKISYR